MLTNHLLSNTFDISPLAFCKKYKRLKLYKCPRLELGCRRQEKGPLSGITFTTHFVHALPSSSFRIAKQKQRIVNHDVNQARAASNEIRHDLVSRRLLSTATTRTATFITARTTLTHMLPTLLWLRIGIASE